MRLAVTSAHSQPSEHRTGTAATADVRRALSYPGSRVTGAACLVPHNLGVD